MKRRTVEQGLELARRFFSSGLSQAEFARRDGVSLASLRYWLRRARKNEKDTEPLDFVEVTAAGGDTGSGSVVIIRLSVLPSAWYLAELLSGMGRG